MNDAMIRCSSCLVSAKKETVNIARRFSYGEREYLYSTAFACSFQLPASTLLRAQLGHPVDVLAEIKFQMSCFARPSLCRGAVSAQARRWMSACRVLADGSIRYVPWG